MEISEAIIHQIDKASGSDQVSLDLRPDRLPIEDTLSKLVTEVLSIYNRVSNGYGAFDADQIIYPFSGQLQAYYQEEVDFIQLSETALRLIASKMGSQRFATGGYVLLVRYTNLGRDWFLVGILKMREATGVDQDTKELLRLLSLDVDHLHEAARVDIRKWQENEQSYLSFVKKRAGKEDVTKYFREALGCTDYTDSKQNTVVLLEALQAYTNTQTDSAKGEDAWTREKAREVRQKTFEYCQEKTRNREDINLGALSSIINDRDPEAFRNFVRDNGYHLNDEFAPHSNTYRKLQRITGKASGNIKVAFDVDDLVQRRISLDGQNLIIQGASPELIAQIEQAQADDDDSE
ncbi:nucleoid-associated protein [Billgrantia sp. Q4P2]|uniref:nucleoid-associated protein n=1 Tax=Billgrantia sp. Q4P2 TaxID=3463857 RepID=UPI004056FE95